MRRLSIPDLTNGLASAVPGHRAGTGGVALSAGGERSHPEGRHVHEFPEATGLHHAALIGLGVVLFAITIVVNMFARSVAGRTSRMLGTTR